MLTAEGCFWSTNPVCSAGGDLRAIMEPLLPPLAPAGIPSVSCGPPMAPPACCKTDVCAPAAAVSKSAACLRSKLCARLRESTWPVAAWLRDTLE
eukprot:1159455-Pelagomonas_calceolata.AAC.8